MRHTLLLLLLVFSGCKCMGEKLLETATGGQVKLDGNTLTVKNEKGETVTMTGNEGKLTVTNDKGETATVEGNEQGVRIVGKEGTAEFGTGKVPEGFPLKVIDGAKVESGMKSQGAKGEVFTLMATVAKESAAIADFYEADLKAKGFKIERVQNPAMANLIVLSGKKPAVTASITITREAPDKPAALMISWNPE